MIPQDLQAHEAELCRTCNWDVTAFMGTALAAAEVNEVMLFARGAAAFAAAAAAMDSRCATISVGDQLLSFLTSCCFSFSSACARIATSLPLQRLTCKKDCVQALDSLPLHSRMAQDVTMTIFAHKYGLQQQLSLYLHGRDCILGAVHDALLSCLCLLGSGGHGVSILHCLCCRPRDLLGYMGALMRGRHKLQLVSQSQCARLQEQGL